MLVPSRSWYRYQPRHEFLVVYEIGRVGCVEKAGEVLCRNTQSGGGQHLPSCRPWRPAQLCSPPELGSLRYTNEIIWALFP